MKRIATAMLMIMSLVAACAPAVTPAAPAPVEVTRQVEVTRLVTVTQLVEVTRLVPVTVTPTETPLVTPTITPLPSKTPLPPAMLAKLQEDKGDGNYLIGVDIAPGVWRSNGTSTGCSLQIFSKSGDIMDTYLGKAAGTCRLPSTSYRVEFKDCGTWKYVSAP